MSNLENFIKSHCWDSASYAFITSRLDYCNSLYAHCNVSTRQPLQRVQNRAARLVLNVPPRTPSLPLLQQLHWLPIEARISYKLCSLMYRVTHGTASLYLVELCQPCSDTRLYVLRHATTIMSPVLTGVLLIVPFLFLPHCLELFA